MPRANHYFRQRYIWHRTHRYQIAYSIDLGAKKRWLRVGISRLLTRTLYQ
jgi:hypothetical protein